jgi:hypothetical protein
VFLVDPLRPLAQHFLGLAQEVGHVEGLVVAADAQDVVREAVGVARQPAAGVAGLGVVIRPHPVRQRLGVGQLNLPVDALFAEVALAIGRELVPRRVIQISENIERVATQLRFREQLVEVVQRLRRHRRPGRRRVRERLAYDRRLGGDRRGIRGRVGAFAFGLLLLLLELVLEIPVHFDQSDAVTQGVGLHVDAGAVDFDAADDVGGALRQFDVGVAELAAQAEHAFLADFGEGVAIGLGPVAVVEPVVVAGEFFEALGAGLEVGGSLSPRFAAGAQVGGALEEGVVGRSGEKCHKSPSGQRWLRRVDLYTL